MRRHSFAPMKRLPVLVIGRHEVYGEELKAMRSSRSLGLIVEFDLLVKSSPNISR